MVTISLPLNMTRKEKRIPQLIVEKSNKGFWGRVDTNHNLVVGNAPTLEILKKQMKKSIYEIEKFEVEEFNVSYDLTSFFEQYTFLNITDIAKRTSINSTLMRQYAAGIKFPSTERVQKIEEAIRSIGKELAKVKIHTSIRNGLKEIRQAKKTGRKLQTLKEFLK